NLNSHTMPARIGLSVESTRPSLAPITCQTSRTDRSAGPMVTAHPTDATSAAVRTGSHHTQAPERARPPRRGSTSDVSGGSTSDAVTSRGVTGRSPRRCLEGGVLGEEFDGGRDRTY